MRRKISLQIAALAVTALSLGGCASFERHQPTAESRTDDDTYCKTNGGPPGSPAYVACRKDRDVAASHSDRMEKTHRDLAERMLNGQ